jgi:pimeloyl-[acyl-carrier protein] methyl ester esterase
MILKNGRQLIYLDVGTGPVLVLLHGWGMSSGLFADMVRLLAKDFRLLIPDLPGHGGSDPGDDHTLEAFSLDIQTWLESLQIENCSLLGWSFGGQIAMQLVANDLVAIHRMILVASTPKFCQSENWAAGLPQTQVRAMARRFRRDPQATLDEFVSLMFAGENNARGLAAKVSACSTPPDFAAGQGILATLETSDLRDQLGAIHVPILIHHGSADAIIPASAGEFLSTQIPGAEAVFWEGVGHVPFLSRPQPCQSLWKEFLL